MQPNVQGISGTFGCCDFQLPRDKGQPVICGRSMEFPIPTESTLFVQTRDEKFQSKAPDGTTGVEWVSKYGYVAMNAFGVNVPDEGLNEAGLSFSFLSLECTQYQEVQPNEMHMALGIKDVGAWILGKFATIAEVKEALKEVKIWGDYKSPLTQKVMGVHIALHDATGNNLVIEFIDGKVMVHENPIGVLTNDPPFEFHQQNLRQFNYLSPKVAPSIKVNGTEVPSFIEGNAMKGLPGDWSTVSRFIRVATMVRFAKKVEDVLEGVNLSLHLLNVVDRPKGLATAKIGNTTLYGTTRWATVKVLSGQKKFFWRTYDDLALRCINLSSLDFSGGKKYKAIPLSTNKQTVIDMTDKLFA